MFGKRAFSSCGKRLLKVKKKRNNKDIPVRVFLKGMNAKELW